MYELIPTSVPARVAEDRDCDGTDDPDVFEPQLGGCVHGMTPPDRLARTAILKRDSTAIGDPSSEIERLAQRIEELEFERDAAENFAALAAHELMAPLVMVEACVSLAADRLDGRDDVEDVLEAFTALGRGAERTRRLVESLLHQARASGWPLRRESVDLRALAADCVAVLEPEIAARSAKVEIRPLPTVRGEEELLGGLLTNLLTNALKFNPRQGGAVVMSAKRTGPAWTISVESEGPPVALEDRERIFEPFHRGRRERRVKGAGLGLAICRRIVERHGGSIGVSPTSVGNRFHFTLPA
jgi:chemotaxis family two-component system sensor kinase Cph1